MKLTWMFGVQYSVFIIIINPVHQWPHGLGRGDGRPKPTLNIFFQLHALIQYI